METFGNIYIPSGSKTGDILESEDGKKIAAGVIPVNHGSGEQKQDAIINAAANCPQVAILKSKKPAHYKMFSGPKGEYLYSERCVPVQVAIINPRPGLELSVTVKYRALTHQHEAVQACPEHFNITPAESKGMDLRTPNKAAFVLMAGFSRSVQYELEGLDPMAHVTLNADEELDVMNLVFPCYSSCKPHKNCGNLMLLCLNIRDINLRKIVSSSVLTVRVAANVRARAYMKYEEDMLGNSTFRRRPAKRPMPGQGGEGLNSTAEVVDVAKRLKLEHGDEKKDDASDAMDVMDSELIPNGEERANTSGVVDTGMDHPEVNIDGDGWDDPPDVVESADFLNNIDRFAKEAVIRTIANIQAEASSSTLATDDNASTINATGSASNPIPLLEASYSTNHSMGNGATSGISLDSMARPDDLPIQMDNNQTSMVPIADNFAVTVTNQNKTPPKECSSTSSTSMDCSNNPPISWQKYTVSDDVGLLVRGLKNPESDYHKIRQFIESLGASCSHAPVLASCSQASVLNPV